MRQHLQDLTSKDLTSLLTRPISILVVAVLSLTQCVEVDETAEDRFGQEVYFDLESFIETQASILEDKKMEISRLGIINGKEDSNKAVIVPDWKKELVLFKEANINKPVLVGQYATETRTEGGQSITTYKAKDPSLSTQYLEVIEENGQVSKLTITHGDNNMLYSTSKDMQMHLKDGVVENYKIEGFQKLIIKDTLFFSINVDLKGPTPL